MEKQDGRAFVGYCNNTPHYLFRKSKLNSKIVFDIENENLIYCDAGTHWGLQTNFVESNNPEKFNQIRNLCNRLTNLVAELDNLINEK